MTLMTSRYASNASENKRRYLGRYGIFLTMRTGGVDEEEDTYHVYIANNFDKSLNAE